MLPCKMETQGTGLSINTPVYLPANLNVKPEGLQKHNSSFCYLTSRANSKTNLQANWVTTWQNKMSVSCRLMLKKSELFIFKLFTVRGFNYWCLPSSVHRRWILLKLINRANGQKAFLSLSAKSLSFKMNKMPEKRRTSTQGVEVSKGWEILRKLFKIKTIYCLQWGLMKSTSTMLDTQESR